ncbi:MAG: diacylglycerol kinase [Deltaproteobacteria bacterium]|nr:MAG: diacylglycerol kinase [Deltaproteobacteria bacterium]
MKRAGLIESFRVAGWGVLHTIATQRHMKVHVTSAVMVMIVGMALPLSLASRVALLFSIALVFFAEILNTALEHFVDLHIAEFERGAMLAKDAAAAGVLVLAAVTVFVLADILYVNWALVEANVEAVVRSLLFGLPLTGVVIVMLFGPARWWVRLCMLVAAAAFVLPLVQASTDPVFSILLGVLVVLAAASRRRPEASPPAARAPD